MKKRKIEKELHILSNLIMRHIENFPVKKQMDAITGTNGWIIGYLAHNPEKDIFQKDLEKEFGITRSTTSKVINRMVSLGLIEKEDVASDARLKKLKLTPQAWKFHYKMQKSFDDFEEELLTEFSEKEVEQLHFFIERMKENLL